MTGDQLLCERGRRGEGRAAPRRDEAVRFLLDELSNGAIDSAELEARAEARGIAVRTLDRARGVVGVEPDRRDGRWTTRLPLTRDAAVTPAPESARTTPPAVVIDAARTRPVAELPSAATDDSSIRFSLLELDLEGATSDGVLDSSRDPSGLVPRTPACAEDPKER